MVREEGGGYRRGDERHAFEAGGDFDERFARG
jgi:hypothetical protein